MINNIKSFLNDEREHNVLNIKSCIATIYERIKYSRISLKISENVETFIRNALFPSLLFHTHTYGKLNLKRKQHAKLFHHQSVTETCDRYH